MVEQKFSAPFLFLGIDEGQALPYNNDLLAQCASKYREVEQSVARRAHNPKVTGSSPVPATNYIAFMGRWPSG